MCLFEPKKCANCSRNPLGCAFVEDIFKPFGFVLSQAKACGYKGFYKFALFLG